MVQYPYLLVAEKSLLALIPLVINSLERNAKPSKIYIIVPHQEVSEFKSCVQGHISIISENDVLPDWSIKRVRQQLKQKQRAGWYLQQFLKLSFGEFANLSEYVIWDADTVALTAPKLTDGSTTYFCKSREYHRPYFGVYTQLLNNQPSLECSVISQYMLIKTSVVRCLQTQIQANSRSKCWISGILETIPGEDASEFSEYETYANFFNMQNPTQCKLTNTKWFRYGAAIIDDPHSMTLEAVTNKFRGYQHVAFERHPASLRRKLIAKLLLFLGK